MKQSVDAQTDTPTYKLSPYQNHTYKSTSNFPQSVTPSYVLQLWCFCGLQLLTFLKLHYFICLFVCLTMSVRLTVSVHLSFVADFANSRGLSMNYSFVLYNIFKKTGSKILDFREKLLKISIFIISQKMVLENSTYAWCFNFFWMWSPGHGKWHPDNPENFFHNWGFGINLWQK